MDYENLDVGFVEYGKYGERFLCKPQKDGKFLITCSELDIIDKVFTKEEYDDIYKRYIEIGEPNIDRNDSARLMSRAVNMGNQLSRYHYLFDSRAGKDNTGSLHLAILIAQILRDAKVLELDDEKYVDWFLTHGAIESQEYIDLMLYLRERVK